MDSTAFLLVGLMERLGDKQEIVACSLESSSSVKIKAVRRMRGVDGFLDFHAHPQAKFDRNVPLVAVVHVLAENVEKWFPKCPHHRRLRF